MATNDITSTTAGHEALILAGRSAQYNEIVAEAYTPELAEAFDGWADVDGSTTDDRGDVVIHEYWGTTDGGEWRVHLRETVAGSTERDDLVTVETMPDHLRGSHRAARNWGVYPLNGAERQRVTSEQAEDLIAEDGGEYNHIVESP